MMNDAWKGFQEGNWTKEINVKDFILKNYTQYNENEFFLENKTEKTEKVWTKCTELLKEELKKGVLDIDIDTMSGINAFEPGYIDK